MNKKIVLLMTLACLLLLFAGCGNRTETKGSDGGTGQNQAVELVEASGQICEQPAILTSMGQSADVDIVDTLCNKVGLEVEINGLITADEITSDYKTLILAVGGSSKGLGAAGIDSEQELERTKAVIEKAKAEGLTIIAMHTGGSARRGTLSDAFITPAFETADVAVVVKEGDEDGLMAGILSANQTPCIYIDQIAGGVDALKKIFGI